MNKSLIALTLGSTFVLAGLANAADKWKSEPGAQYAVHVVVKDGSPELRETIKLCPVSALPANARAGQHGESFAFIAIAPSKPCPKAVTK